MISCVRWVLFWRCPDFNVDLRVSGCYGKTHKEVRPEQEVGLGCNGGMGKRCWKGRSHRVTLQRRSSLDVCIKNSWL